MSHRIKEWGAGPWHASARLDPGKRSRRGKRTIPQSPTGRGPRASLGVFTSAPAGRIKERTSIFLAPFPRSWTALPGPQCGGDEPCLWAGATCCKEPALLCPLLGGHRSERKNGREGCDCPRTQQDMGTRRPPEARRHWLAWCVTPHAHLGEEKSFSRCHLATVIFSLFLFFPPLNAILIA